MAYSNVVKREIKRLVKFPLGFMLSFIFPFIMCLIICIIFAKGIPTDLPICVADYDNSKLSRLLVRNINTLQVCKVTHRITDLCEGKKLITEGKIYAFINIPKNFQRDIYRLQQPQLTFYYNNQRILIGGIIAKDVNQVVQSMLVGLDAKVKNKHGIPFKDAVKQSNLINVIDHIRSNPYFNYQYFLSIVAFGHILQINIVFASIWAIGTEFKQGKTKEWIRSADRSIIIAVLGKLTPYFISGMILSLLLGIVYFGFYGVPFSGNILIAILMTIMFLTACLSLGIIFISINGNFRYCLSFGAFYVAMGFALAGVSYPVMSMPLLAKIYGATSPLNSWVHIMLDQSMRNIPPIYDLRYFITPLCIIFIASLCLIRLKKMGLDKKRWFKI